MTRLSAYVLILLAGTLLRFAPVAAQEMPLLSEMAGQLNWLINYARAYPLETAANIGLDPNQVLSDFPDMAEYLQNGLPPLQQDESLDAVALNHTTDMLANDFYGYDASDGQALESRLLQTGYDAKNALDTIGVVGFVNFIDPKVAVLRIFTTLFRSELDPGRTRPRLILSPAVEDIGVSFGSGRLTMGGDVYNVYLATIVAAERYSLEERFAAMQDQLRQMVNQFRAAPLSVCGGLGIDLTALDTDPSTLQALLEQSRPPLTVNLLLEAAAVGHTQDMIANDFIGHISSDGRFVADRMIAAGYPTYLFGESIEAIEYSATRPVGEILRQFLRQLVLRELNQYIQYGATTLLSGKLSEFGIAMGMGIFNLAESQVQAMVCDITLGSVGLQSQAVTQHYVSGTAYHDSDLNMINDLEEGLQGASIVMQDIDGAGEIVSTEYAVADASGGFIMAVPAVSAAVHRVTIFVQGQDPAVYEFSADQVHTNVWLEHRLAPPAENDAPAEGEPI